MSLIFAITKEFFFCPQLIWTGIKKSKASALSRCHVITDQNGEFASNNDPPHWDSQFSNIWKNSFGAFRVSISLYMYFCK